jgi:cell division protein ZapE
VYLYGGVGRGKSFLMDCFFQAVPLTRKTRLHFHESCAKCIGSCRTCRHREPARQLGERMARRFRLLCFDEFHVSDITDAMILHRLLLALVDNGVGFVTTSTSSPMTCIPTACTATGSCRPSRS